MSFNLKDGLNVNDGRFLQAAISALRRELCAETGTFVSSERRGNPKGILNSQSSQRHCVPCICGEDAGVVVSIA